MKLFNRLLARYYRRKTRKLELSHRRALELMNQEHQWYKFRISRARRIALSFERKGVQKRVCGGSEVNPSGDSLPLIQP